ncbi:hypothetical protein J1C56_29340 [Aminobacter anthyllidis]|uniref:Uncharacterized protein n=1 Tax=Aminobacter anthyllidis TaxID=1035067 RepID=A0A9X1AH40_9HYPH|nr:hypothetical protein [Aminobacter anthyllidis]MBT1159659.1 hypothetical protein [Aminobacter anthyllidis]
MAWFFLGTLRDFHASGEIAGGAMDKACYDLRKADPIGLPHDFKSEVSRAPPLPGIKV